MAKVNTADCSETFIFDITSESEDKNQDDDKTSSENTCPCCNNVFEDLSTERVIQKLTFLKSYNFVIAYLFCNEIFVSQGIEKEKYYSLYTIPITGREILALHSVLII